MQLQYLPQLVSEKVYFYYDLQKWYDNIEKVNKEYDQKVKIDDIGLVWMCKYNNRNQWNLVLWLTSKYHIYNTITKFTNPSRKIIQTKPPKYHYSSGLNHPHAYR